jgi:hypothetical protein
MNQIEKSQVIIITNKLTDLFKLIKEEEDYIKNLTISDFQTNYILYERACKLLQRINVQCFSILRELHALQDEIFS